MEQVIIGGFYDLLHVTATEYNALQIGGRSWSATELYLHQIVSTGGKLKNLRIKLNDSPGAGTSYVFTVRLNGAPTALTCTIADAATIGSDMVNEVTVAAGDFVDLECNPAGTPTARYATWTIMFEGDTAKESLILGGGSSLGKTSTQYNSLMGQGSGWDAEGRRDQLCPTAGKIKNLYILLSTSPGTSPDAYRFTLRLNGANTALTVTITAPNTTGNDVVNEVTVAAGDVLTLQCEPLESPSATPYAYWGMTFLADTDGESVILSGTSATTYLSDTFTRYIYLASCGLLSWAGESQSYHLGQSCTLKKLYVQVSGAPGAGKSWTFTLRKGDAMADGNLTVTIADAATTGNDVVNTDAIANDIYVDLKVVPSGTPPNDKHAIWGIVVYIEPLAPPGWTGKISGVTNPAKIMGVDVANIKSVKGVE